MHYFLTVGPCQESLINDMVAFLETFISPESASLPLFTSTVEEAHRMRIVSQVYKHKRKMLSVF